MKRNQLGELIPTSCGGGLQPARGGGMEAGAFRACQGAIRDVTNQDVAKDKVATANWSKQVPIDKALDGSRSFRGQIAVHRCDPGSAEATAEDRADLNKAPRGRVERVQAREDGGLYGVRKPGRGGGHCLGVA